MDAIKASVLEKLIRELCPEGVEYRELSELFKTKMDILHLKETKSFGKMEIFRGLGWMTYGKTEVFYHMPCKMLQKKLSKESYFPKIL